MRRVLVSVCIALMSIGPASARMYQWRNAATGTTQLSGTPPAWYRSDERGPRVYVFENNKLVDDTGITVSAEQRETLRSEAFGQARSTDEARVDTPPPVISEAAPSPPPAPVETPPTAVKDRAAVVPGPSDQRATADKAAALKSLIDAWDQRQLDEAHALIEALTRDDDSASDRR